MSPVCQLEARTAVLDGLVEGVVVAVAVVRAGERIVVLDVRQCVLADVRRRLGRHRGALLSCCCTRRCRGSRQRPRRQTRRPFAGSSASRIPHRRASKKAHRSFWPERRASRRRRMERRDCAGSLQRRPAAGEARSALSSSTSCSFFSNTPRKGSSRTRRSRPMPDCIRTAIQSTSSLVDGRLRRRGTDRSS